MDSEGTIKLEFEDLEPLIKTEKFDSDTEDNEKTLEKQFYHVDIESCISYDGSQDSVPITESEGRVKLEFEEEIEEPLIKREKFNSDIEDNDTILENQDCDVDIKPCIGYDGSHELAQQTQSSAVRNKKFRAQRTFLKQQRKNVPLIEEHKRKKTSADRTRRWRKKSQLRNEYEKNKPKTPAERVRAYRARQKLKNAAQRHHDHNYATSQYDYNKNKRIHVEFNKKFRNNSFGHSCSVCDRLWFKDDLKVASANHENILKKIMYFNNVSEVIICSSCKVALDKRKIPNLSTYNGYKYPEIPSHLPKLDHISEKLISPRTPFIQIRRLRWIHGQNSIYEQTINVPISSNAMANRLPKIIDDDCIYVHINRKKIYKFSNFLNNILVNKESIEKWLQYLVNTPLYTLHNIAIDEFFHDDAFFSANKEKEQLSIDDIVERSEEISVQSIKNSFIAQQHTLLWDENFLGNASGENDASQNLFDQYSEELYFPSIYAGQLRTFRNDIKVSPFLIISSEIRRKDRRGVTPDHLLYIALKILRLRIRECLSEAAKYFGSNNDIKKLIEQIKSGDNVDHVIESYLPFFRSIPNSPWYWEQRKQDLFSIIRQKGRPTAFMTLNANEIEWLNLIQLLYKLVNNGDEISERAASELSLIEKSALINKDAVTCAIYFNKLINVIMGILQSKILSPFCKYRVVDYYQRIEFQHHGSPSAHILLWLDNAPNAVLGDNYDKAVMLIDSLISVSASQASGYIKLQTHKHTFRCYEKNDDKSLNCRFEDLFMPCRSTMILTPMPKSNPQFQEYAQRYSDIKANLKNTDYKDVADFYYGNNIKSDNEYRNILRAGITTPKIFYKRHSSEKWHIPFNPFILSVLKSNMNFQIITDDHSCAYYLTEYINKSNRRINNLQRKIIEIMNENSEFNLAEFTQKIGVDMVNCMEMSSQEAAWYVLREPICKTSVTVHYINTARLTERQNIKKVQKESREFDEDSKDTSKEDWFDQYENRPYDLEYVTLAQFVSKCYKNIHGLYAKRINPRVIRYRKYDKVNDYIEYKREMVTLHIPFRNENANILADMKFISIYDDNEDLILQRRKEFESNLDIQKIIEICQQLSCEDDENISNNEHEVQDVGDKP